VSKPFTVDDARALTDKIKKGLQETWKDIQKAWDERADKILGYSSWDAYCAAEFGSCYLRVPHEELPEIVRSMSLTMGVRPIAAALGVSRETVRRARCPRCGRDTNVSPKTPPKPDRYIQQFNDAAAKFLQGAHEIQQLCKDNRFAQHREALVKNQSETVMFAHELTTQLVRYFADPGITLLNEQDSTA
jgi:hypothetical protein